MGRPTQPVAIAGIEFDALLDESKAMNSSIPTYPIENGFPVTDTIINDPIQLTLSLYLTNTPVTWLSRHGNSTSRVDSVCKQLENLWESKQLVKIVTSSAIYTDMGISSISIKHSQGDGNARQVEITAQKVVKTRRATTTIPAGILKSGTTGSSAGTASTSNSGKTIKSEATAKSGSSSSSSSRKKSSSTILYNVLGGVTS